LPINTVTTTSQSGAPEPTTTEPIYTVTTPDNSTWTPPPATGSTAPVTTYTQPPATRNPPKTGGTLLLNAGSFTVNSVVIIMSGGWQPGEQVTVTVYSDPIQLGVYTASAIGELSDIRFSIPRNFDPGTHTITAVGETSGTVSTTFQVTLVGVVTGGTVIQQPPAVAWLLIVCLIGAGLLLTPYTPRKPVAAKRGIG